MGVSVLIYTIWSGKAGSCPSIFFLCFPTLCGSSRAFQKHRWLEWFIWFCMAFIFIITMVDLGMARSGDPWFSSTFCRTITGVIGSFALAVGCMIWMGASKALGSTGSPTSPRFWPS